MNKYHAKKTEVDGIVFASIKESNRYCELKLLQKCGLIDYFKVQPEFELQKKFKKNGVTYRSIKYIADFIVYYPGGKVEVEDCKGFFTKEFRIKHKLFEYQYPDLTLKII